MGVLLWTGAGVTDVTLVGAGVSALQCSTLEIEQLDSHSSASASFLSVQVKACNSACVNMHI
jgi:hypothetical protein